MSHFFVPHDYMASFAAEDFLYERKGPWPQPATAHPFGEAPQVLHVPKEEVKDWQRHIGRRYTRDLLTRWPAAMRYANQHRDTPVPDDTLFAHYMLRTLYTRFLYRLPKPGEANAHDERDLASFAPVMASSGPGTVWWRMDFSAMEVVTPIPGTHVASTVVLVREDDGQASRRVVAIRVGRHLFTPDDGVNWDLAKMFALQGAAYHVLFVVHPALHFPMDSVNAITKTAVPRAHPIFQTLFPHTRFTLPLDHGVLEGKGSVVNKNAVATIYDPLTGDADKGLRGLFAAGYSGYAPGGVENPAYPRFCFRCGPPRIPSDYGTFLEAYFEAIEEFTTAVAVAHHRRHPKDEVVYSWAAWVGAHLRGLPDAKDVTEDPRILGRVMGRFLFDVSVGHGTDHQDFSMSIPTHHKYLRIRVRPPVPGRRDAFSPRDVMTWGDLVRAALCERMFFAPTTVTRLISTQYQYRDETMRAAANQLRQQLKAAHASVPHVYMPLDELPASIQY